MYHLKTIKIHDLCYGVQYMIPDLYRVESIMPAVDQVRHGVAITLNLEGTQLAVHGKVGEVHGTGGLNRQSHAPQNLPQVGDPQKLVLLGCLVEVGSLLVDKKGVWNPDLTNVVCSHNQLGDSILRNRY